MCGRDRRMVTASGVGNKLVPVANIRAKLVFDLLGLPGASRHPLLLAEVSDRLTAAQAKLRELDCELLILDSFQPGDAHHDSHVTGAAVDVTLIVDGQEAWLGTEFGGTGAMASPDWFHQHPPESHQQRLAHRNRELLREVMEDAGFVISDVSWSHFEYGTTLWAAKTGGVARHTAMAAPPELENAAVANRHVLPAMPTLETGVAQPFLTADARAASLAHREPGHYYARTSQPTIEGLERAVLTWMTPAAGCQLTACGLAATRIAVTAVLPAGGLLVYDRYIYYEAEQRLRILAADRRWRLVQVDFTQLNAVSAALDRSRTEPALLYCDSPRNWYLESLDITALGALARSAGARLCVDTTLQPCQDVFAHDADIAVCSLSKYPSAGLTMGGVVLCADPGVLSTIRAVAELHDSPLAPEAAFTIWQQLPSLPDRMTALSAKATNIAEFLCKQPAVRLVRLPDPAFAGGMVGGQLSFHLKDPGFGPAFESIVGHNALTYGWALRLACTFGSLMTTVEHFASNKRSRSGEVVRGNEDAMPHDIVRLGVGMESESAIVRDLGFVLSAAERWPEVSWSTASDHCQPQRRTSEVVAHR